MIKLEAMKPLRIICMSLLMMYISPSNAQVKIGDNPTTINSNSILELESNNKGILCPRIALNDVNSVAPLSGTVTESMLVYNASGTVERGFYYWNGSKWVKLMTDVETRSNYVLVKSESDLPAPVAGVITLTANTLYEINGTVNVTNKINLNECTMMGMDHMNDKLVYTQSSGELFTGANGGTLKMLTVMAPVSGAKLFNIDAATANKNIIVQNCVFAGTNNLGSIKNSTGYLLFTDMIFTYNTNGISLENITKVHLNNLYFTNTNYNTFVSFVGTFETIRIAGGSAHSILAQNAKVYDISGISSIEIGDLKAVLFHGDGSYVIGTFSKQWEVETHGLPTQKDREAGGNIYITTPIANPIAFANVPEKISGTTTAVNLFRMTAPVSNRLVYTGTKTRYFSAIASVSISSAASSKNFSFYIAKNGVVLPESKQTLRMSSSTDKGSLTISCNVELAPNDYVEVFVENNTDLTGITVLNMNMAIR